MSNNTHNTPKNAPVDRVRVGRIAAAIWRHTTDDGAAYYNFTLERTYKDSQGAYQSSGSFALSDALVVAKVANLADTRIRRLLDADYAANRGVDDDSEE